jgi:hypothetical protein
MKLLLMTWLGACASCAIAAEVKPGAVTDADRKFLADVVSAVERKDVSWIVRHSNLPMATGNDRHVMSESEYALRIREALTDGFCARFRSAANNEPFKNWRGVMIGRGILWCMEVERDEPHLPMTYLILALGNFAFQPSLEIISEEEPPR